MLIHSFTHSSNVVNLIPAYIHTYTHTYTYTLIHMALSLFSPFSGCRSRLFCQHTSWDIVIIHLALFVLASLDSIIVNHFFLFTFPLLKGLGGGGGVGGGSGGGGWGRGGGGGGGG